jgi:hypothetical protein
MDLHPYDIEHHDITCHYTSRHLLTKHAKLSDTSPKPFPFNYAIFPKCQRSQYIMHDELNFSLLFLFRASHLVCWQGKNITNYR